LFNAQGIGANKFVSGTDKGLHAQACVVPMYNNVINTPVQETVNSEFSSYRAANECDVGKPKNLFKFIDYRKVLFRQLGIIGLFF